jgi:hypothetical protein
LVEEGFWTGWTLVIASFMASLYPGWNITRAPDYGMEGRGENNDRETPQQNVREE